MFTEDVRNIFVAEYSELAGVTHAEATERFNEWLKQVKRTEWDDGYLHGKIDESRREKIKKLAANEKAWAV